MHCCVFTFVESSLVKNIIQSRFSVLAHACPCFYTKKENFDDSDVFDDEFDYDDDSGSDYDWDEPGDDEDQV